MNNKTALLLVTLLLSSPGLFGMETLDDIEYNQYLETLPPAQQQFLANFERDYRDGWLIGKLEAIRSLIKIGSIVVPEESKEHILGLPDEELLAWDRDYEEARDAEQKE